MSSTARIRPPRSVLAADVEAGLTHTQVMQKYDCTYDTVRKWLRRYELPSISVPRQPAPKQAPAFKSGNELHILTDRVYHCLGFPTLRDLLDDGDAEIAHHGGSAWVVVKGKAQGWRLHPVAITAEAI